MGGIFICYRREDSAVWAGRLYDDLSRHFGPSQIVRDIEEVMPGDRRSDVIERAVGSRDAVLVVIGRDWLSTTDQRRGRLLDDPHDFVRLVLVAALRHREVQVIPVLVEDAPMPEPHDLPEPVAELAEHFAIRLSDTDWEFDMYRLIAGLEKVVGSPRDAPVTQPEPEQQWTGIRIFINYRHEDTSGHAGRLYDRLTERFGEDSVFIDFDKIRPGRDFVEEIDEQLSRCDVFLALIGRSWLTTTDRNGRRRLDDRADTLRLELEAALRQRVTIIPLLLQESTMPTRDDLPDELAPFARRQAFPLSDRRWRDEVGQLVEELEQIRAEKARQSR